MRDFRGLIAAIPQSPEYLAYADAHWRELIERYDPCVLWNDIGYPRDADLPSLFEHYYQHVPDGVVNNRFDFISQTSGTVHADFVTPEYSTEAPAGGRKWESTRGMGTSFGHNRTETDADHLGADELVHLLVDVVARGGNLLLNVGPAADGAIPWVQARRLLALGWWLRTNGAAVYGSRPWARPEDTTADGQPVRFTVAGDALHAVLLGVPSSTVVELPGIPTSDMTVVDLLGYEVPLDWERAGDGVRVTLPAVPAGSPAPVLRFRPVPRQ